MAQLVIALLMLVVAVLFMLFLLIVGLSIALVVFSRKGTKRQELSAVKETGGTGF
jgi:hypothetical protein